MEKLLQTNYDDTYLGHKLKTKFNLSDNGGILFDCIICKNEFCFLIKEKTYYIWDYDFDCNWKLGCHPWIICLNTCDELIIKGLLE